MPARRGRPSCGWSPSPRVSGHPAPVGVTASARWPSTSPAPRPSVSTSRGRSSSRAGDKRPGRDRRRRRAGGSRRTRGLDARPGSGRSRRSPRGTVDRRDDGRCKSSDGDRDRAGALPGGVSPRRACHAGPGPPDDRPAAGAVTWSSVSGGGGGPGGGGPRGAGAPRREARRGSRYLVFVLGVVVSAGGVVVVDGGVVV